MISLFVGGPITTEVSRWLELRLQPRTIQTSVVWIPHRARGACHRAGQGPDPLARLSGTTRSLLHEARPENG